MNQQANNVPSLDQEQSDAHREDSDHDMTMNDHTSNRDSNVSKAFSNHNFNEKSLDYLNNTMPQLDLGYDEDLQELPDDQQTLDFMNLMDPLKDSGYISHGEVFLQHLGFNCSESLQVTFEQYKDRMAQYQQWDLSQIDEEKRNRVSVFRHLINSEQNLHLAQKRLEPYYAFRKNNISFEHSLPLKHLIRRDPKVLVQQKLAVDIETQLSRQSNKHEATENDTSGRAYYMFNQRLQADKEKGYMLSPRLVNDEIEIIGLNSQISKDKEINKTVKKKDLVDRNKYHLMIRMQCDKGRVGYLKPYAIPLAGINEYVCYFTQETQLMIEEFLQHVFIPLKEYNDVFWRGYYKDVALASARARQTNKHKSVTSPSQSPSSPQSAKKRDIKAMDKFQQKHSHSVDKSQEEEQHQYKVSLETLKKLQGIFDNGNGLLRADLNKMDLNSIGTQLRLLAGKDACKKKYGNHNQFNTKFQEAFNHLRAYQWWSDQGFTLCDDLNTILVTNPYLSTYHTLPNQKPQILYRSPSQGHRESSNSSGAMSITNMIASASPQMMASPPQFQNTAYKPKIPLPEVLVSSLSYVQGALITDQMKLTQFNVKSDKGKTAQQQVPVVDIASTIGTSDVSKQASSDTAEKQDNVPTEKQNEFGHISHQSIAEESINSVQAQPIQDQPDSHSSSIPPPLRIIQEQHQAQPTDSHQETVTQSITSDVEHSLKATSTAQEHYSVESTQVAPTDMKGNVLPSPIISIPINESVIGQKRKPTFVLNLQMIHNAQAKNTLEHQEYLRWCQANSFNPRLTLSDWPNWKSYSKNQRALTTPHAYGIWLKLNARSMELSGESLVNDELMAEILESNGSVDLTDEQMDLYFLDTNEEVKDHNEDSNIGDTVQ